eukprot:3340212-Prymnesium_polylepis.1
MPAAISEPLSSSAHGLPRPGGLADGRVGRHHGAFVSGHVAISRGTRRHRARFCDARHKPVAGAGI